MIKLKDIIPESHIITCERVTLYCYDICTNGTKFAMGYDGSYDAQGLLDGLTPETEQKVINQGYDLEDPIMK